ncbi:hypothetical protein SBADM41S_00966 [Streptomyces badius]
MLGAQLVRGVGIDEVGHDRHPLPLGVLDELLVVLADQEIPVTAAVALVPDELHHQLVRVAIAGKRDGVVVQPLDVVDEAVSRAGRLVDAVLAAVRAGHDGTVEIERVRPVGDFDLLDLVVGPVRRDGDSEVSGEAPGHTGDEGVAGAGLPADDGAHVARAVHPVDEALAVITESGGHPVEVRNDRRVDLTAGGVVVHGEVDDGASVEPVLRGQFVGVERVLVTLGVGEVGEFSGVVLVDRKYPQPVAEDGTQLTGLDLLVESGARRVVDVAADDLDLVVAQPLGAGSGDLEAGVGTGDIAVRVAHGDQ